MLIIMTYSSYFLRFLFISIFTAVIPVHAESGGVVHGVYLWLKPTVNDLQKQQQREKLIFASKKLRAIDGVRELKVGQVISSERSIVDDSFDVGLYFYFDSVEMMNIYLAHPVHVAVVKKEIKPLVSQIRVMDFYDE